MTTALIYLLVLVLVAAVVYLVVVLVFGRGEELAPLPPGASPTRLPATDMTGDDLRAVRFQQVLRGYKMSEVDWVLDRLGAELDALRTRVAELEGGPVIDESAVDAEGSGDDFGAPDSAVAHDEDVGEYVNDDINDGASSREDASLPKGAELPDNTDVGARTVAAQDIAAQDIVAQDHSVEDGQ
ncbi:MAG: DivIVA domain-containing protein [Sciscionella sp.]|nr:DivIVA domain-containing protein [Sciscionella sp.]